MSVRIVCRSGVGWLEYQEGRLSFGQHWDDMSNERVAEQLERIAEALRERTGTNGPAGAHREYRTTQMGIVATASTSDELVRVGG